MMLFDPVPAARIRANRCGQRAAWAVVAVAVATLLLAIALVVTPSGSNYIGISPLLGKPAPAIAGTTIAGQSVILEALRGRWVIINFFGSWCTPCIREHAELIEFAKRHPSTDDATILTVALSDSPNNVRQFFNDRGGDWPVLADNTTIVAAAFGVIMVPETFVVSPTGTVVARLLGPTTAERLDKIIGREQ